MEQINKAAHTPGPLVASYEKRGFLGQPGSDMQKFYTLEACHQPKGVNGRSLIIAEMRVGDESFGFGDNAIRHHVTDEEAEANAARLVHCWNNFDETAAERDRLRGENAMLRSELETLRESFNVRESVATTMVRNVERDNLKAINSELLAALKHIAALPQHECEDARNLAGIGVAVGTARAAITKAKGGAA